MECILLFNSDVKRLRIRELEERLENAQAPVNGTWEQMTDFYQWQRDQLLEIALIKSEIYNKKTIIQLPQLNQHEKTK